MVTFMNHNTMHYGKSYGNTGKTRVILRNTGKTRIILRNTGKTRGYFEPPDIHVECTETSRHIAGEWVKRLCMHV